MKLINPIKSIIDKRNHKKCMIAFDKIERALRNSVMSTSVLYLGNGKGYTELLEKIKERGWYYELSCDGKSSVFITVKEK